MAKSVNPPTGAPMSTLPEATVMNNPEFREVVRLMAALTKKQVGEGALFAEVETSALSLANLAAREQLKEDLQRRADAFGPELMIGGKHYSRHQPGEVTYHGLNGGLTVKRDTYREVGVRNGPTVVPLELSVGLVEGATPALGYSVTLGYAQGELRSYAEAMEAAHRRLPSRSSLERMAKAIGGEALKEAPRIEAVLRKAETLPPGSFSVSTGLDRTAAPMEEDRPEIAPPKTRRKARTKPYQRAKPKPIDVNYRMAYVGTVSVIDDKGEALATRRYAAEPDAEPEDIVDRMMADLVNALKQQPTLKLLVVQDGAPEMWNAMLCGMKRAHIPKCAEAIDRYHLLERLAGALLLVEPDARVRRATLSKWNDELDVDDDAIKDIHVWLAAQVDKVEGKEGELKYTGHLVYLERNQGRMRYATLRRQNLPVGSGVTEGACKSVVGQRACGSGQRWRPKGIGAALALRAIHRSDRLPRFWRQLAKNYKANISTFAAPIEAAA
jgi:hypothetical protein